MRDVGLTTRTLLLAGHDRGWDVALYRTAEILHFTAILAASDAVEGVVS